MYIHQNYRLLSLGLMLGRLLGRFSESLLPFFLLNPANTNETLILH